MYGSGSTQSGLMLKGDFATIETDPAGRPRALLLVGGTEFRHGTFQLKADRKIWLSVTFDKKGAQLVSSPPVGYETLEGTPSYTAGRDASVSMTVPSPWSPTGEDAPKSILVPGQTENGPVPVDVQW